MEKTTERDKQVIQNLLSQVGAISKKYKELAKVTGENFNVFRVLKIHSDEVRMHSALLGELLNPHASHGQKDVFLKLFIEQYNKVGSTNLHINNFNTHEAQVDIEKHIGAKTEIEGGRIDILITDNKGKKIIIENKIYAGDQEHQLVRYFKHDETSNLCYLTLDGKAPNDESIKYTNPKTKQVEIDLTGKFVQLSYEHDILNWLEQCLKEAVKHSMLRETIAQYINLIKFLTNQSTNQIMEQEIIHVILKDENNLEMALQIADSKEEILSNLITVLEAQLGELAAKYDLKVRDYKGSRYELYSGFKLSSSDLDAHNLQMHFEFGERWNHDFYFGFSELKSQQLNSEKKVLLKNLFDKEFTVNEKPTEGWPCWSYFKEYRNFSSQKFLDILNGKMIKTIEEKVVCMLKVFNDFKQTEK
jgi:hypothetical protein